MKRLWIAAAAAFAIDQLSKLVVVHGLNLDRVKEIEVFPPYLVFMMGWNTGINFGVGADGVPMIPPEAMRWVLIGLAVAISTAMIVWARKMPPLGQVSAGLVVGGALANALDRVIYGAVADFLNMSCCGIDNPFAFNLADVFIFAGAFGLILWGERKTA